MNKLNKAKLKTLILETLQEMDPERTGTSSPDVSAGMDSEPTPEELAPLDIAGYFKQVGDELEQRIAAYEEMPKPQIKMMSQEELKAALDEMNRVQDELKEIGKVLHDLEKRHMQGDESED